ncbi:hypothetical protein ACHAXT_000878 [Thalassiosira profunda]
MGARSGFVVAIIFCLAAAKHRVASSPAPRSPPSASPTVLPNRAAANEVERSSADAEASLTTAARGEYAKGTQPSRQKSSSVTFLYELYEHEIYNPKTDSWTSRRFTQSPVTGGGGRDSTSLEPQSCSPPRNYVFEGEWRIDMASESRDGFGWEYYVGRYDGLGRRRRRWVRSLKRVSAIPAVGKKQAGKQKKAGAPAKETKTHRTSAIRAMRDQYNFKGFGWSFYKSFVFARSVGAAFRIPLSANFDSYDKYLAAPYISSSTYFGFPWVVGTFLNASLPLEAIKWLIGGVLWKIQWGLAVVSALIRDVVEAVIWVVLWPWRLWKAWAQMMGLVASRLGPKKEKEEKTTQSLMDDIDGTETIIDSEGTEISIETHVQMNNSSEYKGEGETPAVPATAVVDSPRGGASANVAVQASQSSTSRKKHLTISGREVPTFRRPYSIEYSSTVQERIGVCISWRVSQERGYEYRWNFFFTCLPTVLFWGQLEEERKRRMDSARRAFAGIWGKTGAPFADAQVEEKHGARAESKSLSRGGSKAQSKSAVSSFLSDHFSTLGLSAGWPLPVDPFFSFNLMLSMSGFYYGWLLRAIRSLFILPLPSTKPSLLKEEGPTRDSFATAESASPKSSDSEKIVSSALKNKKLPLEEELDDDHAEGKDKTNTDEGLDGCLANATATDVNVAGV